MIYDEITKSISDIFFKEWKSFFSPFAPSVDIHTHMYAHTNVYHHIHTRLVERTIYYISSSLLSFTEPIILRAQDWIYRANSVYFCIFEKAWQTQQAKPNKNIVAAIHPSRYSLIVHLLYKSHKSYFFFCFYHDYSHAPCIDTHVALLNNFLPIVGEIISI